MSGTLLNLVLCLCPGSKIGSGQPVFGAKDIPHCMLMRFAAVTKLLRKYNLDPKIDDEIADHIRDYFNTWHYGQGLKIAA